MEDGRWTGDETAERHGGWDAWMLGCWEERDRQRSEVGGVTAGGQKSEIGGLPVLRHAHKSIF